MIKNDRQYRITRAQAERFQSALSHVADQTEVHPSVRKAQESAVRSQLAELEQELEVYESLKAGLVTDFRVEALSDLPRVLIQARIARGFTHKDLAAKLGLKEQQIQRYESTDYASANVTRLQQVADALGVTFGENIVLDFDDDAPDRLFGDIKSIGLDKRFVLSRLLPQSLATRLTREVGTSDADVVQARSILARIFQWSPSESIGGTGLRLDSAIAGQARFKLAARVHEGRMIAYTAYAWYLSSLLAKACDDLPRRPIEPQWEDFRHSILEDYGEVSFATVLRHAWDLGVVVLPLMDPGVFDAACWRIAGRNVIVLKQNVRSPARWLFDLLHEVHHAAADPDEPWLSVIEFEGSVLERKELPEEEDAHEFAGDVILGGRAEELTALCVARAKGRVPWLKRSVQEVAAIESVPADALANYLAFRLSLQGINWWGTAANLQEAGIDPFGVARDELLGRAELDRLDEVERDLVAQALEEPEN